MAVVGRRKRFLGFTEEELVGYYLKNKILGKLSDSESKRIPELDLYGTGELPSGSGSISVFRDMIQGRYYQGDFQWKFVDDGTSRKYVLYVFTKLNPDNNNNRLVAGCGNWHPSSEIEEIVHDDSIPGYKRSFTFTYVDKTPPLLRKPTWTMIEYSINPAVHGIGNDYVLCKLFRSSGCPSSSNPNNPPIRRVPGWFPTRDDQRLMGFFTKCSVQGEEGLLVIDNTSYSNFASTSFVEKLGLSITPLNETQQSLHRSHGGTCFDRCGVIKVDGVVKLKFSIGDYADEVSSFVSPQLSAVDVLLGRPRQYDRRVTHDGFSNKYHFVFRQVPITLEPMWDEHLHGNRKNKKK